MKLSNYYVSIILCGIRFYMDLRRQEETERDAFMDECLSDLTLRNQISIVSRKYKNEIQVHNDATMLQIHTHIT